MTSDGARNPAGLHWVFDYLGEDQSLRTNVANFAVKYRLVHELKSTAFDGESATTDSYYVLLKISILYSAIEAVAEILGEGNFKSVNRELAESLIQNEKWTPFVDRLQEVVKSPNLKQELQSLGQASGHFNLVPLLQAVRHGFFHPRLTAQNSYLAADATLRAALLKVCETVAQDLNMAWYEWAYNRKEGARILKLVREKYGVDLSDNQLRILLDQLDDDDYSEDEILDDVVKHIDEYEQEYLDWEQELAKAKESKKAKPDSSIQED